MVFSQVQVSMDNDIAIISYSFRFPGIETEEALWKLLVSKGNTFTDIPPNRNLEVPLVGSFFKNPDLFDNAFFHLSTQEARAMDRQQRILLELAWHCFEASYIPLEKLQKETTGVFVGSMLLNQKQAESSEKEYEKYLALGVSESILSNRLSYFLRCNGPSVTINTACSSSIAALHAAKEALLAKRCQYAFVGASNMIDNDLRFRSYKEMGILSQVLPYRAFSSESSGFVPGEGGVVVLLTTCEKATEEGIPIYGIIKGSALNHTGLFSSKSLTAPSVHAQTEVIQNALKDARLKPNEIDYLECHGTGTLVGDPIELAALNKIYGAENIIYPIGSIKHNILDRF